MTLLLCVLLLGPGPQPLRLAPIFADHMVLQRDQPLHFWGKGLPGARVWVSFAGDRLEAKVKKDSTWSGYGRRYKADANPQQLVVSSGGDTIVVNDILIGDLWLCLGQSNMEFPMSREMHFKSEAVQSEQPLLRLYNPAYIGKEWYGKPYTDPMFSGLQPATFYSGTWQQCDSGSVRTMSAVGYYFGKTIAVRAGIPVGLINLAIGGCPAETFISRAALRAGGFGVKLAGNWLTNDDLPVWVRTRGQENIGGVSRTGRGDGLRAGGDDGGPNHAYKPGFAYAAGIDPLTPLAIRGVIWYQGESNAQELPRVIEYRRLMKLLIASYRKVWHQPALPFYWVQLSSIDTARYVSRFWPEFRDEQRRLLAEISHGGMAVSSDLGFRDNVHPTDKKDVGERLARWAFAQDYGVDTLVSGPLPINAGYADDTLTITFNYAPNGLQTADDTPVRGFSLDRVTDAPAIIDGYKIMIPAKEKPLAVYYGWKPYTDANLCNREKLPASTFKIIIP